MQLEIIVLAATVAAVLAAAVTTIASRRKQQPLEASYDPSDGERFVHRWGYTDTRFEFDGPRSVRLTGSRYPLAGYSLPGFIPFIEEVIGIPFTPDDMKAEEITFPIPTPVLNAAFVTELEAALSHEQISRDDRVRLAHSHGQVSVAEIYHLLYRAAPPRIADLVVYPESGEDVRTLIALANDHEVCLVPYGGGTNVSGALTLPQDETRTIVSVDMRRMNKILWVDDENMTACVQAGIQGKDLEFELDQRGFTCGHDPDSVEFSTLGGWISTNASGMKKNRYGNIEDIVMEATLVTPTGDIETRQVTPRYSTGVAPRSLLFGSEGNFGIITKAIIRIHRRPDIRRYGFLVFRRFEDGVRFLKALRETGVIPASIRLVNNSELRFGQALKPKPGRVKRILDRIQKFFLFKILRFRHKEFVACILVMEGSAAEVRHQRKTIFPLAKQFGAVSGGSPNGKRGYTLTFGIAYIRDFVNRFNVLGESFETSVPWDRIHDVCKAVREELAVQMKEHAVQGTPYLGYRATQTYHTGVCIYFTMGFSGNGLEDPEGVFHDVESRLRQVILDNGGSLSHHHGVGKIRNQFLPQVHTENSMRVLRETKRAMDPQNVFGIQNGAFVSHGSEARGQKPEEKQ